MIRLHICLVCSDQLRDLFSIYLLCPKVLQVQIVFQLVRHKKVERKLRTNFKERFIYSFIATATKSSVLNDLGI